MDLGTAVSLAGTIGGAIESISAAKKMKKEDEKLQKLFTKRTTFKTPSEIIDIKNLTQMNAAQGFSDDTLNYLTGQAGSGLAGTLAVAKRLGANPNDLNATLDKYYGDIAGIGAQSDLVKLGKFDKFTNALQGVAANAEAEWQSQENLIKDQMAAASSRFENYNTTLNSGVNLALQGLTNLAVDDLYTDATRVPRPRRIRNNGSGGGTATSSTTVSTGGGMTPSEILTRRNEPI